MVILPSLPFAPDDLSPAIPAEWVRRHHDEIHARHAAAWNVLCTGYPALSRRPLAATLTDLGALPGEIRQAVAHHGGAHMNHSLLWQVLRPAPPLAVGSDVPRSAGPGGPLAEAIGRAFGGGEALRRRFERLARAQREPGWLWLCAGPGGALEILSLLGEKPPAVEHRAALMGVDLWPHALAGAFAGRPVRYVRAIWQVLDWERIETFYAWACMSREARASPARPGGAGRGRPEAS